MVRRPALACVVLLGILLVAAPARAATVTMEIESGVFYSAHLFVTDPAGAADDLTIDLADDKRSVSVTGATAHPGAGCRRADGVTVVCDTEAEPSLDVDLGAGDDRLFVDGAFHDPTVIWIEGGDGNDTITAQGVVLGRAGNDTLRVGTPTELDELYGDEGDDQLYAAGRPATLVGGPGTDVLHGGPGNDALIDVGDGGSRDTLMCGPGGGDIAERDRGDRLVGCSAATSNVLSVFKYRWQAWPDGQTEPLLLQLNLPAVGQSAGLGYVDGSWKTTCSGRGCHGARFRAKDLPGKGFRIRFLLRRGGVKIPGSNRRGVLPGARITMTYAITLGSVRFTKSVRWTTRRGKLPRLSKSCLVRPQGERERRVPCG